MRIALAFVVGVVLLPAFSFAASACATPPGHTSPIYNARANSMVITYYVPHNAQKCATSMQGCIATSCPGLKDNLAQPTCLDAIRLGQAQYVTIASAASNYGKYFSLGDITYTSALDGQRYTVPNVVGYVHDTGCAFNGTCSDEMRAQYGFSSVPRPDKLDVCTTACPWCTDAQASALVTGRGVSLTPSTAGVADPNLFRPSMGGVASAFGGNSVMGNPYGSYPLQSPYSAANAFAAQGAYSSSQGAVSQPAATQPLPGVAQSVSTAPQAASALLVQPQNPARNGKVIVSWTSAGMANGSCILKINGQTRSTANEGSTAIITAQGTYDFAFSCRDSGAVLRELADSITVP